MAEPKKKPDPIDPMAGLPGGMLAGMATLQQPYLPPRTPAPIKPRTAGPHSPVQPGLAPTNAAVSAAAAPSAFESGQLTRTGLQVAPKIPGLLAEATGIPGAVRSAGTSIGNFVRGLAGAEEQAAPAPAAAPASPAATLVDPRPSSAAPRQPTPAVAAPAPAQAPAPRAPTLQPGDVNTFTGSNGVARAVPGLLNQSAPAPATMAAAPAAPAAPTLRPTVAGSGAVGASIGIPGEEERKRTIAIESALRSPARSRSARALQGQMVQGINASFDQRAGIEAGANNAQLEANTRRGISAQELAARAAEGDANRTQRAGEFGVTSTLQRDQLNAENQRGRQVLTGDDGTSSLLRNDGSMAPITNADGSPFRERNNTGTITDSDLFSAYSKEAASINENTLLRPEERTAALAALQQRPEFAGVLQKVGAVKSGAGAAPPAAVAFLKANPDKAAEFDAKFGKGASATYLSP